MFRNTLIAAVCAIALYAATAPTDAVAQEGYAQHWSRSYNTQDWNRFYHYPYVYYPHNYWSQEYFRSSDSLYQRYPAEMRVPAYNKANYNMYPSQHKYYQGNHFRLDIF